MSASIYEAALDRMMASGVPFATAKAISTEAHQALGPFRSVIDFATANTNGAPATSGSPSAGDSYIMSSGRYVFEIAMFAADGIWHFSTPAAGDIAYVQSVGAYYSFVSGAWVLLPFPVPVTRTITIADTPYSVPVATGTLRVDASSGNIAVSLPVVFSLLNKILRVKRVDTSTNTVTVSGVIIDGSSSLSFLPWDASDLQGNGSGVDIF